MTQTWTLDPQDMIRKGIIAYNASELQAQNAEYISGSGCSYYDGDSGCKCVIGAGLPEDAISFLMDRADNGTFFLGLVERGFFEIDLGDAHKLQALQDLHDNWLKSQLDLHKEPEPEDIKRKHRAFHTGLARLAESYGVTDVELKPFEPLTKPD